MSGLNPKPIPKTPQDLCDAFNHAHKAGDTVRVWDRLKNAYVPCTIRAPGAFVLWGDFEVATTVGGRRVTVQLHDTVVVTVDGERAFAWLSPVEGRW
jgi:hypothetical protein